MIEQLPMINRTKRQRVIIVSNRLPFTISLEGTELKFQQSVGGVARGLSACINSSQELSSLNPQYLWVGWPGGNVPDEYKEAMKSRARSEFQSQPVFLSEQEIENFYQGFCNRTIWPLFHYFPSYVKYEQGHWEQYKKVNQVFAEALLEVLQPDDALWIHDYHLMLLPRLIREQMANVSIGFFLHIPFPDFEVFRLLPREWRKGILEGLLGADLIGFHTHDYMEYFLRCVLRILGFEHRMGRLVLEDHAVKVGAFPMGIDFQEFHTAATSLEVRKEKEKLKKAWGGCKLVLSVDRQDYSKGILHRLEGFEILLEKYPEWRGKVTLFMIVVPSRIGIEDYERMKNQIEELVGRINGKFGSLTWVPIAYQYRAVPFHSLVAAYAVSDAALVTPLRDGMNLVAKEYIACKTDKTGVLILSEMAGAAKELREAVIVNPNNREEIAEGLREALEMPSQEQVRRNGHMQRRLRRYDVSRWAGDFLKELILMSPSRDKFHAIPLSSTVQSEILECYQQSVQGLLLLDYDGTLVPFAQRPELAKPTREVLKVLDRLAADPRNEVVIISGRDRTTLEDWFGELPIGLVAEHGAWVRKRNEGWKMMKPLTGGWKTKLLPVLEIYADRLPGALVEEKEFSLAWHYRASEPDQGALAARELTDDLLAFTSNIDLQVLQGSKVVEVRNAGVDKGLASQHWLDESDFDFILAIGDDTTDEDMFAVLPGSAYSIRIGIARTRARFATRERTEVFPLLKQLVRAEKSKQENLEEEETLRMSRPSRY